MNSITQSLFSWQVLDESSDIFRFRKMLDALDDAPLILRLEEERKGRRNDYPIAPVWNSLLAGLIFGHPTTASLRRELRRNAELRQVCGFDPLLGDKAVPTKDTYYRFMKKLTQHQDLLLSIFQNLVFHLGKLLPDLGKRLALDGKSIKACRKDDQEASVGCKKTTQEEKEVTYEWFGYKLHMLCDATYELPLAFQVTSATQSESPRLKELIEDLDRRNKSIVERAETLAADKAYDDGKDKQSLYDEYGIMPLIPPRDIKSKGFMPLDPATHDSVYISPTGQVVCKICPFAANDNEKYAPMYFAGFEKDRGTLKFRCPASAWGIECHNQDSCRCSLHVKNGSYGRVVRISLERDRRLFGPIYTHSYRFADLYKSRTAVERLFFRLDHFYGFEHHNTRGLARMQVRMSLALIAMLATALGWIKANRIKDLRRMFQAA